MDGFDAAQTFAAPAGSRARSARLGRGGGWHGHAAPGQAATGQAAPARRGWHRRGVAPEGAGEGAGAVPFRPA